MTRRPEATGRPDLVVGGSDDVGFIDAPETGVTRLAEVVADAFGRLAPAAVVSVYSRVVTAADITELCTRNGLELIGTIEHPEGGATFTLSRQVAGDR